MSTSTTPTASQPADEPIQGIGGGSGDEAPGSAISASLGAMRPLIAKLDKLLPAHPTDGMRLLTGGVKVISCYLDELSEVEYPLRTAQCWMNEARDLSYDMEDYIDNILFVQPAGDSFAGKDMEAMVSEFSKYVQKAIERYKAYVQPDSGPSSTLRRSIVSVGHELPTSYEDMVIDDRMDEFINSFAEDGDKQLKVLAVFGSACLGKTTLARVLYSKFGMEYDCRAFVQVSRKPDMKRIFRDMLWQLQWQEPPEYRNEPDLIEKIRKYLRNKRYLIIVDDVWAASVWDTINDALPKGSHGSRIVTTTQIKDVALLCCSHQSELVFEMRPLDDVHSRELFFNRLFGSESNCPKTLQEVSSRVVEMFDGLPFATSIIASLLASQPDITRDLLEHIHESLSSCFSSSSPSERTRKALNLSFNNLPHYLKTCLLYLGIYPQGYTFCNNDLVKQWMAEGFIHTPEGQDAEKVAESYLHQLIDRRFIQPIRINHSNGVLSCAVHETVHDLIAHKSAELDFILLVDHSQKNVTLSHKTRRLSLLFGDARYAKTPENITKSQVRSLTYFGLLECMPGITEFKLLRVLVLQISGHGGKDNPVDLTGISELIQLRYLKVGCGICITLPANGLKCLETLDITDAIVLGLSRNITLPALLHLSFPLERIHTYCWEDPLNFTGIDTRYLWSLINEHRNLRTLVFSHGSTVKNKVDRGAVKMITPKPSMEVITSRAPLLQEFECSPSSDTIFYLIPHLFIHLENLCILKIAVRILKKDCVDILRGLRALAALSLRVRRETAEGIIFDKAGFSALKYFSLRFTTGIPWLKFEKDTMPNLWKLKLVFNAIPKKDHQHFFVSSHPGWSKQYKTGNPLIVVDHMPSLRDISAKFEGGADDLNRIKEIGISIDQGIDPDIVNMQFVDSGSCADQSTEQKHQDDILENEPVDETMDKSAAKRSPESLYVFTLDELMSATNNFSKENFEGDHYEERDLNKTFCFPGIYKGYLPPGFETQQVIIKCLNKFSDDHEWLMVDQMELEYVRELSCHPYLVKLMGFCDYYEHRMLVYEYTPSKRLKQYLSDTKSPWLTRLKIAAGMAKGLAVLHEADNLMVHGDIKASNVLVDLNDTAKLFGYRLANEESLKKKPGSLTAKSDVYKFGVVLLQLLVGEKHVKESPLADWPSIKAGELGAGRNLVEWWRPYLSRQDKLNHIIDPRLNRQYSAHTAWIAATFVRRCLHNVPEKRPSMSDVVEALEPLVDIIEEDEPSQTRNARAGAGNANKPGCSNMEVSSLYPREWRGRHAFTLDELKSATSNFSEENLLGEADFGHIYKGAIDDKLITVMKLRPNCNDWLLPAAWLPELQRLEGMRYPHLVRLLGSCDPDEECFLLVYEYMPRGSLSDISNLLELAWSTRLKVAIGAAKGLSFLHESGKQMIYYTGFTDSSILLASDYEAKLWGFGPAKTSDVSIYVRMATDVYNFGVVLAELLTGQRDLGLEPRVRLDQLNMQDDLSRMREVMVIARRCLDRAPYNRPSIQEVVDVLEFSKKQSKKTKWAQSFIKKAKTQLSRLTNEYM